MFSNMTDIDAFWATRVILSFTKEELAGIVETAEYNGPTTANYMLQTLLDRRRMVASYWLSKVDALSKFEIRGTDTGVALTFKDLMVDQGLVLADSPKYEYQVKGVRYKSKKQTVQLPEIRIEREILSAAIEHGADAPIEISIWPLRRVSNPAPVRIYFDWSPTRDTLSIRRISRG